MADRIIVSENNRFLMFADGKPFFYLGDTAWELFHALGREDAERYLVDRERKGFTVIQAVALAELDGLSVPNAYGALPLTNRDPLKPNEAYFQHVDWIVNRAEQFGLWIGMLPTWGDKWYSGRGTDGVIFTPENAEHYGRFIGNRYRDKPIIWILGGDRPVENDLDRSVLRAMARGLRNGDGGTHLIALHPRGGTSSSDFVHSEPWLDFNMFQSGHCGRNWPSWAIVERDRALQPGKPTLDAEPCYEDHPAMTATLGGKPVHEDPLHPTVTADGWTHLEEDGYFDDYDVRKACYRPLFAGACGHTYGCHPVWQMHRAGSPAINRVRRTWDEAIKLPGAAQVQFARWLIEARPYFVRIPDQSMLLSGAGAGGDHVRAMRDVNGTFAFVYLPTAKPVSVDLRNLATGSLRAAWFDPRTGTSQVIDEFRNCGDRTFTPPPDGPDWVLVIDEASRDYPLF